MSNISYGEPSYSGPSYGEPSYGDKISYSGPSYGDKISYSNESIEYNLYVDETNLLIDASNVDAEQDIDTSNYEISKKAQIIFVSTISVVLISTLFFLTAGILK